MKFSVKNMKYVIYEFLKFYNGNGGDTSLKSNPKLVTVKYPYLFWRLFIFHHFCHMLLQFNFHLIISLSVLKWNRRNFCTRLRTQLIQNSLFRNTQFNSTWKSAMGAKPTFLKWATNVSWSLLLTGNNSCDDKTKICLKPRQIHTVTEEYTDTTWSIRNLQNMNLNTWIWKVFKRSLNQIQTRSLFSIWAFLRAATMLLMSLSASQDLNITLAKSNEIPDNQLKISIKWLLYINPKNASSRVDYLMVWCFPPCMYNIVYFYVFIS